MEQAIIKYVNNNLSFDDETIFGVLVAFNIIATQPNIPININNIINSFNNEIKIKINNYNWRDYIVASNVKIQDFPNYYPEQGYVGLWIYSNTPETYNLISFSNKNFLNGFITLFDIFNLEFRDFILGSPFSYDYNTKEIIWYDIPGYDTDRLEIYERIPELIAPFYLERNQVDPYSIDYF